MIEMEASEAPAKGERMSVDYVVGEGRQIDSTGIVQDPAGAWTVTEVAPRSGTGLVVVWLVNRSRPDLE
jgi:hypothetical protein